MKYYVVKSSHWPGAYEFRSETIDLKVGDCFRILKSNGGRVYPTRFKVLGVNETSNNPKYIVTIHEVDMNVDPF